MKEKIFLVREYLAGSKCLIKGDFTKQQVKKEFLKMWLDIDDDILDDDEYEIEEIEIITDFKDMKKYFE